MRKPDKISTVALFGAEDFAELLSGLAQKEIENLSRAHVLDLAKRLKDKIKARTPTNTGTLKKSGRHRRKKSFPNQPKAITYFDQGDDAKHDGYYWRFIEHGTKKGDPGSSSKPARPFVQPAKDEFRAEMPGIVNQSVMKVWEKRVKREMKKAAKKAAAAAK
jgi:HK97 gp10 family phage protein